VLHSGGRTASESMELIGDKDRPGIHKGVGRSRIEIEIGN
jgi:hypothetical protein